MQVILTGMRYQLRMKLEPYRSPTVRGSEGNIKNKAMLAKSLDKVGEFIMIDFGIRTQTTYRVIFIIRCDTLRLKSYQLSVIDNSPVGLTP